MFDELVFSDKSLDKRQQKTRHAISIALLELLGEKSIDRITISELSKKASVNRKTFYNNYSSVQDVFTQIEDSTAKYIISALPDEITLDNEIDIYNLLYEMANSMLKYKPILKKLFLSKNNVILRSKVNSHLYPYVESNLSRHFVSKEFIPYVYKYIVDGIFTLFTTWFTSDDDISPKQLALLGYNLTKSAISTSNFNDL